MTEPGVFQRHELKYLLTDAQYAYMREVLAPHTRPDPHGESTVCSLYYDTPDYRLIRRSMERPRYKEKLRVRSYGLVTGDSPVFVELKKKYKRVVYKRRISLPEPEAAAYLAGSFSPPDSQIKREIDYFRSFYPGLRPAMFLAYDRTALFDREDPSLRITFDRRVRCRQEQLTLTAHLEGTELLPPDRRLMEIKLSDAMPLWLTRALAEGQIFKTRFSKYGTAYTQLYQGGHIHA